MANCIVLEFYIASVLVTKFSDRFKPKTKKSYIIFIVDYVFQKKRYIVSIIVYTFQTISYKAVHLKLNASFHIV